MLALHAFPRFIDIEFRLGVRRAATTSGRAPGGYYASPPFHFSADLDACKMRARCLSARMTILARFAAREMTADISF